MIAWLDQRDCAGWFADYVTLAARRYGDRVKRFATFNEPTLFTLLGYGLGWHAPGMMDRAALLRAIHHVNLAHGAGVDALRSHVPGASIGAIYNYQPCVASTPAAAAPLPGRILGSRDADPQLTACYPPLLARELETVGFPGDARICRPVDWFGLNFADCAKSDPGSQLGFGWPAAAREKAPGSDGRSSMHFACCLPSSPFSSADLVTENGGRATAEPGRAIGDEQRVAYCDPILTRCVPRCRQERASAAISSGPCSTISSGIPAMQRASASSMSTTRRSNACRRVLLDGTRN
jgi:beta-glucosidase